MIFEGRKMKLLTSLLLQQLKHLRQITKIILENRFSGARSALRLHLPPEKLRLKTSCIWSAK